ncbi:hypothetical protein K491DRAFT_781045 [Lophiostoma macrostomum CBS 122681]|uniref:Uncharacterized protein n=1 Tax=Lophiostoma macrostomum CBS 122681 TaxID=1314788 RepID=A0A6A6SXR6_9PLEO|nr:hypothetical protein K491DRAFT_781045 [Lophiostoma macrostomum CBS 122681]
MATLHQRSARSNFSRGHLQQASPKKKHAVSAASVFKQKPKKTHKPTSVAKGTIAEVVRANFEGSPLALVTQAEIAVPQPPSLNSPQKQDPKLKRTRSSEKHPLAVAFKNTTTAYRTHLYESAVLKINTTHATLLKRLHDANYHPRPTTSPSKPSAAARISVADRIRQETHYLTQPLGKTRLTLRETRADGSQVPFETTLAERMTVFAAHVKNEKAAIETLHSRWELVVGEIWKCGIVILGEEGMKAFLTPPISPTDDIDGEGEGEDSLFIAEVDPELQSMNVSASVSKAKKKVAFKDPLPVFLTQKSRMKPLDQTPELPLDRVNELEKGISELGAKEVEKLRGLEAEQEKWWKKKMQQLEQVWAAD